VSTRTILILAAGDWPDDDSIPRLQSEAAITLAADGGWRRAYAAGLHVDRVIGDLDSLSPADRSALERSGTPIQRYPEEKDWTDLELAVDYAMTLDPTEILIIGAVGGRADQTLTNLHLLEKGIGAGTKIALVTPTGTIRLAADRTVLDGVAPGDRVSLVPLTESVLLSTEGLRYGLHDDRLTRAGSHGVSNVVIQVPAIVDVKAGRVLVFHDRTNGGGG
jgi:thiamine pyrophosphokinase